MTGPLTSSSVSVMKHQMSQNLEWGGKARKQEDRIRGRNNADRRASLAEQKSDDILTQVEINALFDAANCWDN